MRNDYRDYVIKDGKWIGRFEEMYQNCDDPWLQDSMEARCNFHKKIGVNVLEIIGLKPQTMLDIGCGKGNFTYYYHQKLSLKRSYGVDISRTAIEIAQSRYPDISFLVSDIDTIQEVVPISFDLILIFELFWYILPRLEQFIGNIHKLLTQSGIILVMQHFYQYNEQKYGNEIISKYEDLLAIFLRNTFEIVYTLEVNRNSNHDTVTILRRLS